jgi:hypothetical protein
MIKQFEEDNLFYSDKRTWNEIKKEKIILRQNGKIFNQCCNREAKHKVKKGFKIDYHDMLKIKKFIKCSINETIDKGRANEEYIRLLKEMNVANRMSKFER